MNELDAELLAQAMVQPKYAEFGGDLDSDDWMTLFDWHREEHDIEKARAAAKVIIRRYVALQSHQEAGKEPT